MNCPATVFRPLAWFSGPASAPAQVHNWRVIHACEYARDVLPVVEGQVAVGMRPYIVTPRSAGAAELYLYSHNPEQSQPLSLLRSWQDVRGWRKSILGCDPGCSADLVHAHSFAAGMAAVRSCGCVVYDFHECVEELAMSSGQGGPGSWLGRSFRAAEQFIVSRAAVVIVHSFGMKDAAVERGSRPEHLFLVPDPLSPEELRVGAASPTGPRNLGASALVFLAPELPVAAGEKLPAAIQFVLEAFAVARREMLDGHLVVQVPANSKGLVKQQAARMGIGDQVSVVDLVGEAAAWEDAHVVIAVGWPAAGNAASRRSNPVCLKALYHGAALLAADVPSNRDASPEGHGCLWFTPGNARDLGGRMAFLGANPDFRVALSQAGRTYLLESRNSAAIGRKYDEAYRHAAARRKTNDGGSGLPVLDPAVNCG